MADWNEIDQNASQCSVEFIGRGHENDLYHLLVGRLFDKIIISYNNQVLGQFDKDQAFEAHALQFGALYLYDVSYDNDSKGKKLPDNIRCFFQFLSAYFWDIRIKEPSSGTGTPVVKRINPKVKELWTSISEKK